jgi:2-C-methyl-D-erythritol 4-phosphate cytidylyltransferase
MNFAIIPAAGSGHRMGAGRPKQFLEIAGEPILVHTLRRFEACASIGGVLVALPEGDIASFAELVDAAGLRKVLPPVAGGPERRDSVALALARVPPGTGVVAVHDGVRPFVTAEQIDRVVARAEACGAAILGLRTVDTVKEVDGDVITRTLDRAHVVLAQTPQAFRFELLSDAYAGWRAAGWPVTDDASLVERIGGRVEVVEGSPLNVKITTPDDLPLAEYILSRWGEPGSPS